MSNKLLIHLLIIGCGLMISAVVSFIFIHREEFFNIVFKIFSTFSFKEQRGVKRSLPRRKNLSKISSGDPPTEIRSIRILKQKKGYDPRVLKLFLSIINREQNGIARIQVNIKKYVDVTISKDHLLNTARKALSHHLFIKNKTEILNLKDIEEIISSLSFLNLLVEEIKKNKKNFLKYLSLKYHQSEFMITLAIEYLFSSRTNALMEALAKRKTLEGLRLKIYSESQIFNKSFSIIKENNYFLTIGEVLTRISSILKNMIDKKGSSLYSKKMISAYAVLNLRPTKDINLIKQHYRREALKKHPDMKIKSKRSESSIRRSHKDFSDLQDAFHYLLKVL